MIRKLFLTLFPIIILFNLFTVQAQSMTNIEILDIESNKIIKTIPTNPTIQLEVKKILIEIDDIVRKIKPIPNKGYMVKIPLEPSIPVDNEWVNALIDEVIIIFPEDETPYILLFDDENRMYFFTFETNSDTLRNTLGFPL